MACYSVALSLPKLAEKPVHMLKTPLPNHRQPAARIAGPSLKHDCTVLAIFHVGAELFAVDASAVQEITLMAHLSAPSGLPAVIAGFLNIAQRPIPIIRLHRLLGIPEPKLGLYTQILILRDGAGASVGWIVDKVVQVVSIPRKEMLPVPENHCFRNSATGLFTANDTSVSILAPDRVLLEQERRCVLDFQAMEQERLRELEHPAP